MCAPGCLDVRTVSQTGVHTASLAMHTHPAHASAVQLDCPALSKLVSGVGAFEDPGVWRMQSLHLQNCRLDSGLWLGRGGADKGGRAWSCLVLFRRSWFAASRPCSGIGSARPRHSVSPRPCHTRIFVRHAGPVHWATRRAPVPDQPPRPGSFAQCRSAGLQACRAGARAVDGPVAPGAPGIPGHSGHRWAEVAPFAGPGFFLGGGVVVRLWGFEG